MITIEQAASRRTYVNGSTGADVESLIRELATLRAQNKQLRSHLEKKSRASVIVERAVIDANALVMQAFASEPTSRKHMLGLGMSRWRWGWASALLRYAGIIKMDADWRSGLVFAIEDLNDCANLIEIAARELLGKRDGLKRLKKMLRM